LVSAESISHSLDPRRHEDVTDGELRDVVEIDERAAVEPIRSSHAGGPAAG
jgi:hypothetical protein